MTAFFDALAPVGIFAIIFGSITAHRYMRHRETIKLIEHGYPPDALRGNPYRPPVAPPAAWPPPPPAAPGPLPLGGAIPPPSGERTAAPHAWAEPAPPYPQPLPAPAAHSAHPAHGGNRAQLVWGCILAGVGVALSLALWPIGFAVNAGGTVVFPLGIGPWMVAGFIPLFVGLALLLAYTVAQPARPPATYLPAPPPGPPHIRREG